MVKLVVTSSVAGRHRAGAVFTGAMTFDPDHFTREQLAKIIADPVLTVVAGNVVKAENLDEYFDQVAFSKAFLAAEANGHGLMLTEGRPGEEEPSRAAPGEGNGEQPGAGGEQPRGEGEQPGGEDKAPPAGTGKARAPKAGKEK